MALLWVGGLKAQYDPVKFNTMGKELGLLNSRVNSIIEDDQGFIWVGTRGGLFRFDGYDFKAYVHDDSDSTTVSANDVSYMLKSSSGSIWVGTWEGGLNHLDPITGKFTEYRNPHHQSSNTIKTISEDAYGNLWIATFGGGLYKFDPKAQKFFPVEVKGLGGNDQIFNFVETTTLVDDTVWVGSLFDGLGYCAVKELTLHQFEIPDTIPGVSKVVSCMTTNSKGHLLLADRKGGVIEFNRDTREFKILEQDSALGGLAHEYIWTLLPDQNDQLWVGTMAGLSLYNPKIKGYRNFVNSPSDPYSLVSNTVYYLFKDSRGIVWVGTWEGGLAKYDRHGWKFKEFNMMSRIPEQRKVFEVAQATAHDYYLATAKGLLHVDRRTYDVNTYEFKGIAVEGLSESVIRNVKFMGDSTLLVASDEGIFTVDLARDFSMPLVMQDGSELPVFEYRVLHHEKDKIYWVGSMAKGLMRIDLETNTYEHYLNNPADANSIRSNFIMSIHTDVKGRTWIGTKNGLNLYNEENNNFERVDPVPYKGLYLGMTGVRAIVTDHRGVLWLGTASGLVRYDYTTNDMKVFSKADGLPDQVIYGMVIDGDKIWASTNNGIFGFHTLTHKVQRYTETDGLLSNEYNYTAYGRFKSGEIYFGNNRGVNFFFPKDLELNQIRPTPYISDVRVRDSSLIGHSMVTDKHVVEVDFNDKTFTVEFSAINFTTPSNTKFSYMLAGFEDQWNEVNWNQRVATYTNLDPGMYSFMVRASNNDGLMSRNHARVLINVVPPYWKTWWFTTLIVLAVGFIIYGIFRWRLHAVELQKRQLEEEVTARTAEIAEQKLEIEDLYEETQDNINTAKFIQLSILPTAETIGKLFKDHMVLWKPKDVVSGDFYWMKQKGTKAYFAVADCTGHGVYGAFTSLIAHNQLNSSLKELRTPTAAKLLDHVNHGVITALQQKEQDLSHSAGMDVCLCVLDLDTMKMEYAGAHNPLYILRAGEIIQLKGDSFSVGMPRSMRIQPFTNNAIQLEQGDQLYLFSDGFADQKGGPRGKKFYYPHFRDLLARIGHQPMAEQQQELDRVISSWMEGFPQIDDILVLGLKI